MQRMRAVPGQCDVVIEMIAYCSSQNNGRRFEGGDRGIPFESSIGDRRGNRKSQHGRVEAEK